MVTDIIIPQFTIYNILKYLMCSQLEMLLPVFPDDIVRLTIERRNRCPCSLCTWHYWTHTMIINRRLLEPMLTPIIKKCASISRINYIRTLHYGLRCPNQIFANYLQNNSSS